MFEDRGDLVFGMLAARVGCGRRRLAWAETCQVLVLAAEAASLLGGPASLARLADRYDDDLPGI